MAVNVLDISGNQKLVFLRWMKVKINHLLFAKVSALILYVDKIYFDEVAPKYCYKFISIERVELQFSDLALKVYGQ